MTAAPRLATAKPVYIHATAVLIGAAGLLIRGPSRSGKSSLALALLEEASTNSQYGRLVGDDRVSTEELDGNLILRGHPAIQGKIEQRGHGILDVAWVPSAIAAYVVDLVPADWQAAWTQDRTEIAGVSLPLISLAPAATPRARAGAVMTFIHGQAHAE